MAVTQLVGRNAMIDLLHRSGQLDAVRMAELNKRFPVMRSATTRDATSAETDPAVETDRRQLAEWRALVGSRFARFMCAFLFGAAAGGLLFGWVGDRYGRARGMAASILCYSIFALAAYGAQTPWQLIGLWFASCLGVGGMWPNGVALASEAWSNWSRSTVAGVLGVSANVGLFLMFRLAGWPEYAVTSDSWRWTMLVAGAPLVVGLFAWKFVPESPRWLALHRGDAQANTTVAPVAFGEVFRPSLLGTTLLGIALATVPMMGGWGSSTWMQPWAAEVGEALSPPDTTLQARVGQVRALPGMVGSLLGGWIAVRLGRRRTFFFTSLGCLAFAEYAFCLLQPTDGLFLYCVGGLGFCSGVYYGWLPLCLPELFETRVRSTGAGVSFNFGRIVTALTLVATDFLMQQFQGNYAAIGRTTSLVFLLGMAIIWAAPDTSRRSMDD